jgi:cytoskeletal protein CcmA (bactofilin family)
MRVPSPTSVRFAAGVLVAGALVVAVGPAAAAAPAHPASSAASGDDAGPHFYNGLAVDVSEDVAGDVYAAGQSITISGDVTGDVIAAAQTITISGSVDGDVRLAAQHIVISGDVARSGTLFAARVDLTATGSFGDDVVGAAGDLSISGEVGRNVEVGAGDLVIGGTVGGDVTYTSDNDARIDEGAVSGTVQRIEPPRPRETEVSPWALFISWFLGLLYALVALSLITAAAGLLFPRLLQRVTDHLVLTPWKALLVGFVASVVAPFGLLFFLVSIIGAPFALAGLMAWLVLTLASFVFGAYYLGRLVFRGRQHPVVVALVGGAILIVALQIPWLNILVWVAMVCFGVGAQLLAIYDLRSWRTRPA